MDKKNNVYLLHGSDTKVTQIDFSRSRLRTDFGKGFYLSNKLDAARVWALRADRGFGNAYVVRFEVERRIFGPAVIACKRFEGATLEWLDFVRDNRERKNEKNVHLGEQRHEYDVVSGLIADDQAADVVDRYCRGKITWQHALEEMKYIPDIYQLSLHTEKSLGFIKAVDYQHYKDGKWSGWLKI
jgi:hypothetical protein